MLGFAAGSRPHFAVPLLVRRPEEAERLVVNHFLYPMLSRYLPELPGRVALVAKGCDGRALVELVRDGRVDRQRVVVLGIPCPGLIDLRALAARLEAEPEELRLEVEGERLRVRAPRELELPLGEALCESCLACPDPRPPGADHVLPGQGRAPADPRAGRRRVEELAARGLAERLAFWREEFRRCVRCYACREVCPACSCTSCVADWPPWISGLPRWQDNLLFQLARTFHVVGRCVDCGECERACPVRIPLRALQRHMADVAERWFDHRPGADPERPPLLAAFREEELEELVW